MYSEYYDAIYSTKDYGAEVDVLCGIFSGMGCSSPGRLLDVGCGTGGHSLQFAKLGWQTVGIDIDTESIATARAKADRLGAELTRKPVFHTRLAMDLDDGGFDAAIAMFNVINYLDTLDTLEAFIAAIAKRSKGPFVFDCWNGVAAMLDPPRRKETTIPYGNESIHVVSTPTFDRMGQCVDVDNTVTVTAPDGTEKEFNYAYRSTLWTPSTLRLAVERNGFEVVRVSPLMRPHETATEKDWKIMFTCRKEEAG